MLQAKKLFLLSALLLSAALLPGPAAAGKVNPDCTWNGHRLYGKVEFVKVGADVKVEFVPIGQDLKVEFVNAFPNRCGQWQVVNAFPDLRVEIVNIGADLRVEVVNNFPGL